MKRIIPFEGKVKKEEEKEHEKEEEKEKKETLATVFGERMLGSMPSDEVGVAPAAPATPRLSAYHGPTGGSFAPSSSERAPRRHGATTVFFNTTIPPTMT